MAFKKLLGQLGIPPGWEGRVKDAAYTPPKGLRQAFHYEDLARDTPLRTTKFDFSGLDGSYIQQKGYGAREYPMRCIFSGLLHDQLATTFEIGLLQRGKGKLEHPFYGTFEVIPTGTVARRNDLVQSANQSIVEVTFSTTLAGIYPAGLGIPKNELLDSVAGFNAAAAAQFANATSLTSKVQQAAAKASIRKALGEVRSALKTVSDQTALARRAFDSQFRLVNEGLDVLVGQPLLLARQMIDLVQAPARALAGLRNKLEGYKTLLESLINTSEGQFSISGNTRPSDASAKRNEFRVNDLLALGAIGGSIISVAENEFVARPDAQQAALEVNDQFDQAVEWREEQLGALDEVDTGEGYQGIQDAAANAAAYLVDLSFNLLPERSFVTDRARTPVDLCAELYGTLADEQLQLLIDTNRFTGSEILEVPKGRTVVWYAAA